MDHPDKTPDKGGQSETDRPWKFPGQSSQERKAPPRRERQKREDKDNETA